MARYALGADFGTLSVRALIAQIGTGREVASASVSYPGGCMSRALPDGTPLPQGFALQDPRDYMPSFAKAVKEALRLSGLSPSDVACIGIDATSSTFFPVDRDMRPLMEREEFAGEPHAYAKLWKHHGAQAEADEMTASPASSPLLPRYGGKISVEWMMPKLLETLRRAPRVYDEAAYFVEAGDWIVYCLTGDLTGAAPMAGFKALRDAEAGFPAPSYFAGFDPAFAGVTDKLAPSYILLGARAGHLTRAAADEMGLLPGIPVAAANIDAHVSLPAAGVTQPGDMLMIMGTSICHLMSSDRMTDVPGMCGRVKDGVIPGLYGYESGQTGGGDIYDWATRVLRADGDPHASLTQEAQALPPGSGGLMALDWWNGNRSILTDSSLSGLLVGMTLETRPCQIYRALIESTAYGTMRILDNYEEHGVPVRSLTACGGIAVKNPLVLQIFADVTGREISLARSRETPALGSAMWGAVALGAEEGGYGDIASCAREMGGKADRPVTPDPARSAAYAQLYREYRGLHDLFGRENGVMKRLKGY